MYVYLTCISVADQLLIKWKERPEVDIPNPELSSLQAFMARENESQFNLTPFSSLFKCVYKWHQQEDMEEGMLIWPS